MNKNAKIYVAGHRGMVGSALVRKLTAQGYANIVTQTSAVLDLRNQQAVFHFFEKEKPEYVFLAAAKWEEYKPTIHTEPNFYTII